MFIAITTYGDISKIYTQVINMYDVNHKYVIHYNIRDGKANFKKLKKLFKDYSNITVIRKYKVYWGEFSIVESMLNLMRLFLESGEEIFIHLGAKEINLHSIDYIEDYIIKNKYCSINCDKEYINWLYYQGNAKGKAVTEKNYDVYYKHKFYKRIYRNKNIWFVNYATVALIAIFTNLFQKEIIKIFKYLFSFHLYKMADHAFHFINEDCDIQNHIFLQFSKKNKEIPDELKNIKFICLNTAGPYLVLNRDACSKIIDYPHLDIFSKYCKDLFAPEELFFNTLYCNLIEKHTDYPFTLACNNDANGMPILKQPSDMDSFLFLRRFSGSIEELNAFKIELKKLTLNRD